MASRPPPPTVKTPTEWPCEHATVGAMVECPGTDEDSSLCKRMVIIKACTNPDKPNFGKFYIWDNKEDGGCGYFSYVHFTEGDNKIFLEEAVYRLAKRKNIISRVPDTEIDPTNNGSGLPPAKRLRVMKDEVTEITEEEWRKTVNELLEKMSSLEKSMLLLKKESEELTQRLVILECWKNKNFVYRQPQQAEE